jgi:hypothetical protein
VSDIFQEVQEEYRREQFSKAWEKYRVPIVGAAAGLIVAVAGYQGWTYWRSAQVEASSRLFEAAANAAESQPGEQKVAATAFAELADKGWGGYPFVARLQAAAALAASGDIKGGVALFDSIADDTSDPIFADYARLRAAILLVDTAPLAEIQKRIGKLPASESPWRVEAEEFLGYANWRAGNNREALRLFDLIKNNPSASEGVKRRATELSALINGGTKVADLKTAPTVAPTPRSQLPTIPGMPSFDTTPVTPEPAAPASPTAPTPTP